MDEALSALNCMAVPKGHAVVGNGTYTPAAVGSVARAKGVVRLRRSEPGVRPPRAAFRELPKGRAGKQDGCGGVSLAPDQPDHTALPASAQCCTLHAIINEVGRAWHLRLVSMNQLSWASLPS